MVEAMVVEVLGGGEGVEVLLLLGVMRGNSRIGRASMVIVTLS